jgi:polar amino acid transport system substrate-binding protein
VQRDVIVELYRRAKIPISIEFRPFTRSVFEVDAGEKDGELGRFEQVEDSFKRILRVPIPIMTLEYRPLAIAKHTASLASWETLRQSGLRIGARQGVYILESKLGSAITDRTSSYDSLFKMLLANRIDIAMVPDGALDEYVERAPEAEKAALQKLHKLPSLGFQPMYHYLNERHADLVPLLTRELQGMKKDGTLGRIWKSHERQTVKNN